MGCDREISSVQRLSLHKLRPDDVNSFTLGRNQLIIKGGRAAANCLRRSLLFPTLAMEQRGFYNPHHHAVMDHAVENLWIADQI
jgi:AMMECR1 domain-containing protein